MDAEPVVVLVARVVEPAAVVPAEVVPTEAVPGRHWE